MANCTNSSAGKIRAHAHRISGSSSEPGWFRAALRDLLLAPLLNDVSCLNRLSAMRSSTEKFWAAWPAHLRQGLPQSLHPAPSAICSRGRYAGESRNSENTSRGFACPFSNTCTPVAYKKLYAPARRVCRGGDAVVLHCAQNDNFQNRRRHARWCGQLSARVHL